jgi:hypothetical protein
VFHNPYARHPVPLELVPEAPHWFDQAGEMTCSAFYGRSIWWSLTRILKDSDPIPQVEDLLRQGGATSNDCLARRELRRGRVGHDTLRYARGAERRSLDPLRRSNPRERVRCPTRFAATSSNRRLKKRASPKPFR